MIVLPNAFYTTAEQEAELDEIYKKEVAVKQKELDDEYKRTRKIQKYRATMYIDEKERVFYVCEKGVFQGVQKHSSDGASAIELPGGMNRAESSKVFWKDAAGPLMVTEEQPGGKVYKLDTEADGTGLIKKYCSDYPEFYIKFKPICSGGIAYCAKENIHPAILECREHKLIVEDDNKYDLYCM